MNEESLFAAALAKTTPAERQAFLDQACAGDDALRQRLYLLLAADEQARGILDTSPDAGAINPFAPGPLVADRVFAGRFQLQEKLGEGGMGEVWAAEQTEPVRRRVALKVLRPGFDSARLLARFEQERQALAVLDHPGIAKVLDAGVDETGRPFFAMELIHGVPITRYCDEARLSLRQRLDLFVGVCQGVQHAHQKGIIHRDLKPSNILVGVYDGKPAPKVIDFGVAKATGPKLTEHSIDTEVGTLIGTLEYMSPEQAQLNNLDIDTRSDVYSLGVVLYELLTGSVPFARRQLHAAGLTEMLRIIKEVEPPRPSARLSGSEALPGVAAVRQTEPKKLIGLLRGELDWIVIRALEKDRARRYETANGLLRDVQRYLADEPVEACPPSAGYRLQKFARRHHRLLATAAAFVFLLLLGVAVSSFLAVQATLAQRQAVADRDAKVGALQAEAAQRQRAGEEAAVAKAVNEFLQNDLLGQADIGNQPDAGSRNRNITVREVLDRAAGGIGAKFQGQELTEAAIRLTLGTAYEALGEYPQAQTHLERSLALRRAKRGETHPETLHSKHSLAVVLVRRGEYEKAEGLYQEVLSARRAELGGEHPDTLNVLNDIGSLYEKRGWLDKAEQLLRSTLDTRRATLGEEHLDTLASKHNLADVYEERKQFHLAEPLYKQARDGRLAQLGPDHPRTLDSMHGLAGLYIAWGRYDEAEPQLERVLAVQRVKHGADHFRTLVTLGDLALVYQMQNRFEKAEALHKQVIAGKLAKLDPDHPSVLASKGNLAQCYQFSRKLDKAEPIYREVLAALRRKLGAGNPYTLVTMTNLATLYRDQGQHDKAEPLLVEAVAEARKTYGLGHADTQTFLSHLTILYHMKGTPERAEPLLREMVEFLRGHPGEQSYVLANGLERLAGNLLEQKKYAQAESCARECLALRSKHRPDDWATFYTQSRLGEALLGQKRYAEAEPLLRQGYEGMKKREAKIPHYNKGALTKAIDRLVRLYKAWDKPNEAAEWQKKLDAEKGQPKK
jgi:serine/threonine protein kinase/tetratricopeptide (TPR) repeat protein